MVSFSRPTRSTRLPQREEPPARLQGAIGSCCAIFPSIAWVGARTVVVTSLPADGLSVPSVTAIRNDDGRDATSKPGGACAAAGGPSPGQAPNRELAPNRALAAVPLAIRIGDDRDPTSKPNGACALTVDPSPRQAPNRERPPNREQATVPTTALASQGPPLLRPVQDQARPASPPQPQ